MEMTTSKSESSAAGGLVRLEEALAYIDETTRNIYDFNKSHFASKAIGIIFGIGAIVVKFGGRRWSTMGTQMSIPIVSKERSHLNLVDTKSLTDQKNQPLSSFVSTIEGSSIGRTVKDNRKFANVIFITIQEATEAVANGFLTLFDCETGKVVRLSELFKRMHRNCANMLHSAVKEQETSLTNTASEECTQGMCEDCCLVHHKESFSFRVYNLLRTSGLRVRRSYATGYSNLELLKGLKDIYINVLEICKSINDCGVTLNRNEIPSGKKLINPSFSIVYKLSKQRIEAIASETKKPIYIDSSESSAETKLSESTFSEEVIDLAISQPLCPCENIRRNKRLRLSNELYSEIGSVDCSWEAQILKTDINPGDEKHALLTKSERDTNYKHKKERSEARPNTQKKANICACKRTKWTQAVGVSANTSVLSTLKILTVGSSRHGKITFGSNHIPQNRWLIMKQEPEISSPRYTITKTSTGKEIYELIVGIFSADEACAVNVNGTLVL